MRYNASGRFGPDGLAEGISLAASLLAGVAHVGLDVALAVLIGTSFRARAPWAFMLAVGMAGIWCVCVTHLCVAAARLLRLLNASYEVLCTSRALILPVGVESLSAGCSAILLAAAVWVTDAARRDGGDGSEAFQQFQIYVPLTIGFQILSLPAFVRLADTFGYAKAKVMRELDRLTDSASKLRRQGDLATGSTNTGSLISAESLRAAQRELDSARARHERQERRDRNKLMSISTGGSAQSVRPQAPVLIPMIRPRPEGAQSEGGRSPASRDRPRAFSRPRQPEALTARAVPEETRLEIFGSGGQQ